MFPFPFWIRPCLRVPKFKYFPPKSTSRILIFSLVTQNWTQFDIQKGAIVPGIYRAFLNVEEPSDTFVDTEGWTKGVIFINGFNLGRFNKLGPQQRLYLPAPLLNRGQNTVSYKVHSQKTNFNFQFHQILIFEQFIPKSSLSFSDEPNLG